MSNEPFYGLKFVLQFFQEALGRPLTPEERAGIELAQPERERLIADMLDRMNPIARKRATLAFMKRLKIRQGTIAPDFAALYKKKADFDRKLLGPNDP